MVFEAMLALTVMLLVVWWTFRSRRREAEWPADEGLPIDESKTVDETQRADGTVEIDALARTDTLR